MRSTTIHLRILLASVAIGSLIAGVLVVNADEPAKESPAATATQREFFENKIRPVLIAHCYECHNSINQADGELKLDHRAGLLAGGSSGPIVVPGKPAESRLLAILRHEVEGMEMPQDGAKLAPQVVADFETWIATGAYDPRDKPPTAAELAQASSFDGAMRLRHQWWSLQPVKNAAVPEVKDAAWSGHPIDRFILAKLEAKHLAPAPEAEKHVLLRRVTFALTGLPPTRAEVEAYLNDTSMDAYENVVDRLLASPHFGERWARHWMDVVHYSDTHGYEWDAPAKNAWMYRDYLVRAMNADVPFNRLIREQIAGDLLPPRVDASGINEAMIGPMALRLGERRHGDSAQVEGVTQETMANIVDTVSKGFLGTTIGCSQCHDHKFDAVPQSDYYALAGVFMNTRWSVRSVETVDPNMATIEELKAIKQEIRDALVESWLGSKEAIVAKFLALQPPALAKSADKKVASTPAPFPTTLGELWHRQTAGLQAAVPQAASTQTTALANATLLSASAKTETAAVVSPPLKEPAAALVPPLTVEELRAEHERRAAENKANLTLWVDFTPDGNGAASATEANVHESPDPTARWRWEGFGMQRGQVADGELVIATTGDSVLHQILPAGRWSHVWSQRLAGALRSPLLDGEAARTFSIGYAGGKFAAQSFIIDQAFHSERMKFINQPNFGWLMQTAGEFKRLGGTIDTLKRRVYFEMTTKSLNNYFPPRIRYGGVTDKDLADPNSWFGVSRIYLHAPDKGPVDELARFEPVLASKNLPESRVAWAGRFADTLLAAVKRLRNGDSTAEDVLLLNEALAAQWLSNDTNQNSKLTALVARYRETEAKLQPERTIGSAAEWNEATDERIAIRGSYEEFGDEAPRGHLRLLTGNAALNAAFFSSADRPGDQSSGRLTLAHLIASNDNPLTARVLVNRVWLQLFGEGIVRTPDDFGHLGELPTHPELLDWLAHRFTQDDWSLKNQIKLIVTSRTWRQSGQTVPAALIADPENRLWHHRPIRRLDAEAIRDSLLAVSGRIDPALGGAPIEPYRTAEDGDKRLFSGPLDGNGRRSIYQKMTLMEPPKFLAIFNQPLPKLTTGKRDTTNVPDQALALLNDPFGVAMAKHWSDRLLKDGSTSPEQRAERMTFAAFGRPPQPAEVERLVKLVEQCAKLRDAEPAELLLYQPGWQDAAHALFNAKEFVYVD